MSKHKKPGGVFPMQEPIERMVAAEVKHLAATEYAREREIQERRESRRNRLRAAYRLQHQQVGRKVNLDAVFALVGNVATIALSAWRGLYAIDMVALAEAGKREDFDDLEFLVSRALDELNGMKKSFKTVTLRRGEGGIMV